MPAMPQKKRIRPEMLSVSLPLDTRAALKAIAASAGLPVSTVVAAAVDLGHVKLAVEELRRLSGLPQELAPATLRAALAKMQAAA